METEGMEKLERKTTVKNDYYSQHLWEGAMFNGTSSAGFSSA